MGVFRRATWLRGFIVLFADGHGSCQTCFIVLFADGHESAAKHASLCSLRTATRALPSMLPCHHLATGELLSTAHPLSDRPPRLRPRPPLALLRGLQFFRSYEMIMQPGGGG